MQHSETEIKASRERVTLALGGLSMTDISTEAVKQLALELGADLVGIAAADSFTEAPQGFHPCDVLPDCSSVIVLAGRFPSDALYSTPDIYTAARNQMAEKMDKMAEALTKKLQAFETLGQPIKSISSRFIEGRNRGQISLKHAAFLADSGKSARTRCLLMTSLETCYGLVPSLHLPL